MWKSLKIVSIVFALILMPVSAMAHAEKADFLEGNSKYLFSDIFYDTCNKIIFNKNNKAPQQITSKYYEKSLSWELPAKLFNINCIIKFYDKKNLIAYAESGDIVAYYVLFLNEKHDDVEVCKNKYILNLEKILSEYESKSFSGAVVDSGGYLPDIAVTVASVRRECGDDYAYHYYHIAILIGGKPFYDELRQFAGPAVHARPEKNSQN